MDLPLLRKDFRYLSDKITATNKAFKKLDVVNKNTYKQTEMVRFKILRTHAFKRGTGLRLAPCVFEKHRNNISFFLMKEKLIFWTVEVSFARFDNSERVCHMFNCIMDPVSEESSMGEVLASVPYEASKLFDFFNQRMSRDALIGQIANKDYVLILEYYKYGEVGSKQKSPDFDADDLDHEVKETEHVEGDESEATKPVERREWRQKLQVYYDEVDPNGKLIDMFRDKTLVEYPRFIIVKRSDRKTVRRLEEYKTNSVLINESN